MDAPLEYPFRRFEGVPMLQEIASYRYCQTTWHQYILAENISVYGFVAEMRLKRRVDELMKSVKLAEPADEMLEKCARKICNELFRWEEYMNCIAKFSSENRALAVDIDWCVWLPNGGIDYVKSATKALDSGKLSEAQTFFVLSKFCMEEKMKNISSTSVPWAVKEMSFMAGPLVFYWVCYLKKKLERVPLDEGSTLDKTMTVSCFRFEEKIGLEYFWNRLENGDRIAVVEVMLREIESVEGWHILERLCGTIFSSATESLAVLSVRYLRMSILYSHLPQHQLRVWHRFKDEIADRDFAGLVTSVFGNAIASEDKMRMLMQIWDTADNHHREYVAQYKANAIIARFTQIEASFSESESESESERVYDRMGPDIKPCAVAFDMLCRIILQKPEHERSRLLKQHADGLVSVIESLESLQKMLDLCIQSSDKQTQFKYVLSRSTKMQNTCVSLLEQGQHDDFNAKLEWMFSDGDGGPNAVNEYKKLLLTLMTWKYESSIRTFFSSVRKWHELCQFVDETYGEDRQSAFEVKRMFVKRATPVGEYYRSFRQDFDVIRQAVEITFPDQDAKYFKSVHLRGLAEQLQNREYWQDEQDDDDDVFLKNFVEWCCDHDAESIWKFKKSVSRDATLNAMFTNTIYYRLGGPPLNLEPLLSRLDRYLKWLLGSDEQVRDCKLQAIQNAVVDVKMFKKASPASQRGQQLEMVLMWFCGGDEAVARRFKERRFGMFA